ncbi:sensor histidine kinase [Piscinibacter sakaiensis]|uniref:sensor histidine kinase n=1 Tax=Piscinibacter sakaiensis TaxID=1547922 RepID=UPI003AAD2C9C
MSPANSYAHCPLRPAGDVGAWATFRMLVNSRTVAIVFYLALAFVVTRFAMVVHLNPIDVVLWNSVVYLRQTLISAFSVLLAIALTEAVLSGVTLPTVAAIALRGITVAAAAVGGALLRLIVYSGSIRFDHHWFLPTVGIWFVNGCFGYALFWFARRELRSRRQLAQATQERERLAARGLEARLSALQAQIEPHFLFNTLAHVQRLHETEPGRGREMLRSLIDYLRAALPTMRQSGSTLRRELELARSFLTILQLRMGPRLAFDIDADPALLDAAVPPMVLPTLVENAVKHGLAPLPQGGRIDIRARATDDGRLAIEVADTGRGFTAAAGSGVGLSNTRSRLAALFGDRASLELRTGAAAGIVASLVLPLQQQGPADAIGVAA